MGKAAKQEANRLKRIKKRKLVDIYIATEYVPEMVDTLLEAFKDNNQDTPKSKEDWVDFVNLFDKYINQKRKELL